MSQSVISLAQLERLRRYLDDDARTHIATHGRWRLDAGKLTTALEEAGVKVEGSDLPVFNYAVALYGEQAGDSWSAKAVNCPVCVRRRN